MIGVKKLDLETKYRGQIAALCYDRFEIVVPEPTSLLLQCGLRSRLEFSFEAECTSDQRLELFILKIKEGVTTLVQADWHNHTWKFDNTTANPSINGGGRYSIAVYNPVPDQPPISFTLTCIGIGILKYNSSALI